MTLSRQRAFVTPRPGEDWDAFAARIFPNEDRQQAVEKLRSWNLHLFARIPPGQFIGADVLFIEPPHNARV